MYDQRVYESIDFSLPEDVIFPWHYDALQIR